MQLRRRDRRARVTRLFFFFSIAASTVVAGCSKTAAPVQAARTAGDEAVLVTVAPVVQKAMPLEIRVIGTAEAESTVAVHAQITGAITSVSFKEGDDVT
jgi:multidrug efflux system membrane fusion protein